MKLVQYRNKRYVLLWSPKQEVLRYTPLTGSSDGTRGTMLPCKGGLYLFWYGNKNIIRRRIRDMIKDMERNEQKKISTTPVFRKENDGVEITITFSGEEDNSVTKDAILDILFHAYETRLSGAVL